jgi:hypothetical protein
MTLVITFMEKYTLFPRKRNNYDESLVGLFKKCPVSLCGPQREKKDPIRVPV